MFYTVPRPFLIIKYVKKIPSISKLGYWEWVKTKALAWYFIEVTIPCVFYEEIGLKFNVVKDSFLHSSVTLNKQ